MTKEKLLSKIAPYLQELFGDNYSFELNTAFDSIGMSSIRFILLIVKCEEEFKIEINDNSLIMSKYTTLDDFFDMISNQVRQGVKR